MDNSNDNYTEITQNPQNELSDEQENGQNINNQKEKTRKRSIFVQFPKIFNATTVVALLALLVSFTTTLISYLQTKEQNVQNQKNELRLLLQRTIALPKENAEIMLKYVDNPESSASLGGYITQENVLLFNQIDNLLNTIPQEKLSAIEYFSAASCLINSGSFYEAKGYIEKAMEMKSSDFNIEYGLLNQYANVLFQIGEYDNGRKTFEKMQHIFDDYPHFSAFYQASIQVQTELNWAYAEANSSHFDKIYIHIKNARKHIAEIPEGQGRKNLENQVYSAEMNMSSVIQY